MGTYGNYRYGLSRAAGMFEPLLNSNVTDASNVYPYIFFSFTNKQAIMDEHFPSGLKQKFDDQLDDLKEMLQHKREHLPDAEWTDFVHLTRKSILEHPDQYLDGDLPAAEILLRVVNAVFDDFLKDRLKK